MCQFVSYVLIAVFILHAEAQFEGESCAHAGKGGVCKNAQDCPSASEDIKNDITPNICSFDSDRVIICCIEHGVATPAPATKVTTEYTPKVYDYVDNTKKRECPPIAKEKTSPKTGQKAWDKCIEYQEKYVYPCQKTVALTGSMVRGVNCNHKATKMVVGGENAAEEEFPHMALLGFEGQQGPVFQCGGTVISEWFILTAGHCTYTKDLGRIAYALLGTLKRSDVYNKANLYRIKTIVKHPDYSPPMKYNDLALLKTETKIRMSKWVIPACLDVGAQSADQAIATGWGQTQNKGAIADVLQKVQLNRFEWIECYGFFPQDRKLPAGIDSRTQICYGDVRKSKDTCQGDSGGPLQVKSKSIECTYVVVGVTSFGGACGVVGQPGVYIKVKEYIPWIESVVWP